MTRTLLLMGQNRQEAEALVSVAERLAAIARPLTYEFLVQDALYGQGVGRYLEANEVPVRELDLGVEFETIWPRAPLHRRLRALLSVPSSVAGLARLYDAILCGSESLPSWMVLSEADRQGIPCFRLCVSYLEGSFRREGGWRLRSKTVAKSLLSRLPGLSYLRYAGNRGAAPYTRYYVMGERSKEYLVQEGVDGDRVVVSGIPRFRTHFRRASSWSPVRLSEGRPVLTYIASAFMTHGHPEIHRAQNEQLRRIMSAGEGHDSPQFEFRVKLHPRSELADYDWLRDSPRWVTILREGVDPVDLFHGSHLLTSIASTMSYEAAVIGCPVALSLFPEDLIGSGRAIYGDFPVVRTPKELLDRLYRIYRAPKKEAGRYPGAGDIAHVMHPETANSDHLIAEHIARHAGFPLRKSAPDAS